MSQERFSVGAARLAGWAGWLLGWTPETFWHATPAELSAVLRAMAGADEAATAPDGATLRQLMEMFPDG